MSLADQANPLINAFKEKVVATFAERCVSMFVFGSLGEHGDFSKCSDVDVVLMLDKIIEGDQAKVKEIWDELLQMNLPYADRLSVFWSSYQDFGKKGRFPALDQTDFKRHAKLIYGQDRRDQINEATHQQIVLESAQFILDFMLKAEKTSELLENPEAINKKGARYLTKFVLFPARLLYTLDYPNKIGSNKDAANNFDVNDRYKHLQGDVNALVGAAYKLRMTEANGEVTAKDLQAVNNYPLALLELYQECIARYSDAVEHIYQQKQAGTPFAELKTLMAKLSAALDQVTQKIDALNTPTMRAKL